MILYLDSSALVKWYIREQATADVKRWVREAEVSGTSLIARAEVSAAIGRLRRMKALSPRAAEDLLNAFRERWPGYIRLPLTEMTVSRADELAWQYGLRGYDAVHLAAAIIWQEGLDEAVTLATFDRPLWEAAAGVGLAALPEIL